MSKMNFFIRTAVSHLFRGGQRSLVALLCVAFGVMALVTMTTMSKSIELMLTLKPYELIGGDLTLDREWEDTISPAEEEELKQMQQSGDIDAYTLMDYSKSLTFHLPESGELIFPATGMGVDASLYPLAGNLTFREPQGADLVSLISQPGDVVITRDLALEYKLKVGDALVLADLNLGKPLGGHVRGIASDTPNHQGSKMYYSHETASLLTGLERPANTVLVNAAQPDAVEKSLEAAGWRVFTAQQLANATKAADGALAMGLNDVGLLGLLVGGIGIANTMQVLLRRRRRDVAVWKTLGYTSGQIQIIFVIEAALLGLAGSVLGAALGVLLSYEMIDIFSRTTTVLVRWTFSPVQTVAGMVIGVLTTVIFAMWAIVSTSRVRPLALLRNEALNASQLPLVQGIGLGLMLAVPFIAIATWVLGSFWTGLLVLLGSVVGLAILGLGLRFLVWLATHLMPMNSWPLGRISRNNLRRRGSSLVFAMVALFIGVISLGLGSVLTQGGQNAMNAKVGNYSDQENLAIFTSASDEAAVRKEIEAGSSMKYSLGHQVPVSRINSRQAEEIAFVPVLEGRAEPGQYLIEGAPWGSQPDGVYVRSYLNVPVGSILEVTSPDGSVHELKVAGSYHNGDQYSWPGSDGQVLMLDQMSSQIAAPVNTHFFLSVPSSQVDSIASRLGKALPQASVISLPAYQIHFVSQYQNLFVFTAAMAGLAILAGILLIANSVSLAMLDRRYEIGVLKAVGYSRWQVLATQVVEYTLVAAIVSLSGLLIIWGLLAVVGLFNGLVASLLMLQPATAVLIAAFTVGLTFFTVLAVTWRPANVSPVVVLNDRE